MALVDRQRTITPYPLARPSYGPEEINAVVATLKAGQTTCGIRVREFETKFARYLGRDHAVMVNSGSSADMLVAFGLGKPDGRDEICVPAVTWPTQIWACLLAGYRVRLVDVDARTLQIDQSALSAAINTRTRAVFVAHILGNVGDMDTLRNDLPCAVIEDCCEALGAKWQGRHVGTFGRAAAFSFFFSHLINTMEGGMVVTDDPMHDRQYRLLRSHGWEPKRDYRFWFPTWGMNVRPTEVQGAFGGVQMGRLEQFFEARTNNVARLDAVTHLQYPSLLHGIQVDSRCTPSWHGFPLMVDQDAPFSKFQLCRWLESHQIETRPIVAGNLARQPAVAGEERISFGDLPGADAVHERGFYIGVPSHDDVGGIAYVGEVLHDFMRQF